MRPDHRSQYLRQNQICRRLVPFGRYFGKGAALRRPNYTRIGRPYPGARRRRARAGRTKAQSDRLQGMGILPPAQARVRELVRQTYLCLPNRGSPPIRDRTGYSRGTTSDVRSFIKPLPWGGFSDAATMKELPKSQDLRQLPVMFPSYSTKVKNAFAQSAWSLPVPLVDGVTTSLISLYPLMSTSMRFVSVSFLTAPLS